MSAIADFLLAKDAMGVDSSAPALSLGAGIDSLTLAELWAALQGIPFADEMEAAFLLIDEDDDGAMLFRVPADLTARLAALPHERVAEIATGWTAYEEVGGDAGEMAEIVSRLCALAREAAEKRVSVFLRLTL